MIKHGKRKGYTTGSCAAAAAKAAVQMLVNQTMVDWAEIDTPAGIKLKLPIVDQQFSTKESSCCVIKDAGDDPDITNGVKVHVCASLIPNGIQIINGSGVGVVTKPGLPVDVGQPAINPVPLAMIKQEVSKVLPDGQGVRLIVSIPGGEEKAKRTLNPRLGIEGGLSILGTTGIVEPMSEDAFKLSLVPQIKMAVAAGYDKLLFVPGRIGETWALSQGLDPMEVVITSNFIGYMLEQAAEAGIKKVVIAGHIGKIGKIAAGIFHTHNRIADGRAEVLVTHLALMGAPKEFLAKIANCTTTDAAVEQIFQAGYQAVFNRIAQKAAVKAREFVFEDLEINITLLDRQQRVLATS